MIKLKLMNQRKDFASVSLRPRRYLSEFAAVSLCLIAIVGLPKSVWAATIEFPEEELASESVYPIFEEPQAVKKRNVVTENHFEFSAFAGLLLNDPFFSPAAFGGEVIYHFTEIHGAQIYASTLTNSASQYVDSLKNVSGEQYVYAPAPKYLLLGNYEFTPFYGKISVTKDTVVNLALYFTGGAGVIGIGTETLPALDFGVGQKIYFSPRWGLSVDLRGLVFQGPDPVSKSTARLTSQPDNSYFDKKINFDVLFNLGVLFIL